VRDTRNPFGQIRRAPTDIAKPHRLGVRETNGLHPQLVSMRQQVSSLWKQCRTRRGQHDSPAVAIEESDFEVTLQSLDLLGERRTGDVQPVSGPAEVQLLGDGDEVAQLAQLHLAIVVRWEFLPTSS
jgi:hypothetical protein